MSLMVLYRDEDLVVVNKPPGLLMHRSPMARDAKEVFQELLEEQLGQKVYLAHRLDRKTSGLVLVALSSSMARALGELFMHHQIQKTYHALVRGHLLEGITVTKALKNESEVLQDAQTEFRPLKHTVLDLSTGKYPTTRMSLIEAKPKTGRIHQIRRHLAHLRHYIINDKPHGDCKVNKAFKDQLGYHHMMLHAVQLEFEHPRSGQVMVVKAPYFEQFKELVQLF